ARAGEGQARGSEAREQCATRKHDGLPDDGERRLPAGRRQLITDHGPGSTLFTRGSVYPYAMDEQAFAKMAEEYGARLYAVAFRLLGNRADAEDAVQRALLKSFAARDTYSPRWAVSTWLYRILSNVCIDELRRRRPSADV